MSGKRYESYNRPGFRQGFTKFPGDLIALAQFKRHLLLRYGIGTLLAALLMSLVIAVVGFVAYVFLLLMAGSSLVPFLADTTVVTDGENSTLIRYLLIAYLMNIVPNLVTIPITLVLVSGWWLVYQRESKIVDGLKDLLDKNAFSEIRRAALENLFNGKGLEKERLKGQNLVNLHVPGFDWRQANLTNVTFTDGDLSENDFRNSIIQGATFRGVDLRKADFSGVDMTGVDLIEAINVETCVFTLDTKLPVDSNNTQRPYDIDTFDKIKRNAFAELTQSASDFRWRKRLWNRYTQGTRRVEIPSEGNSHEQKVFLALEIKIKTIIEEFECTSNAPGSHIYASAYVGKSIWFPAFLGISKENMPKYKELRDKYLQAHRRAAGRGIRITRIFIIEDKSDLNQPVDDTAASGTVREFIKRQDTELNMETRICGLDFLTRASVAALDSGREDLILFADPDNPRCYLLSGIGAKTGGSIKYERNEINSKIEAFNWLINNAGKVD